MPTISAKLKELVEGDEVNARASNRKEGITELKASIINEGLLVPLLVIRHSDGKRWEVVDGNRRLRALKSIAKDGIGIDRKICFDGESVDVVDMKPAEGTGEIATIGEALEASLATYEFRVGLHPIDRYEAFARLEADGITAEQIAERFGADLKEVRRTLALGGLHEDVRALWRKRKIDDDAARAFTLERDPEKQAKALAKLIEGKQPIYSQSVRSALGLGAMHIESALAFVGADAYLAAGGAIIENLFHDTEKVVSDVELLGTMQMAKLAENAARMASEGWARVFITEGTAYHSSYLLQRVWPWGHEPTSDEVLAAIEAKQWAWLSLRHDGGIHVEAVLPSNDFLVANGLEPDPAAPPPTLEPEEPEAGDDTITSGGGFPDAKDEGIPKSLMDRVGQWRTLALGRALQQDRDTMLALLIATLGFWDEGDPGTPMRLRVDAAPMPHQRGFRGQLLAGMAEEDREDFVKVFKAIRDMGPVSRDALLMETLAGVLDVSHSAVAMNYVDTDMLSAVTDAIRSDTDQDLLRREMVTCFDYLAFFGTAPKKVADAMAESLGKPKPKGADKQARAAAAADMAKAAGWLPASMLAMIGGD